MSNIDTKILRARVERVTALPTIPMVLKRTLEVIEKPNASLSEISQFISQDPSLTSKLLKMVNSAIYGFPGRISSVSHGVVLLGLSVVKGLLLGVSVFELMQETMVGLWDHSLGCATLSRIIAKRKGLKDFEEIAVAGLLHDLGKVLLILLYPAEYSEAIEEAKREDLAISDAERDIFNATHANVGAWMGRKWNFPAQLVDIIEYHHKPHLAKTARMETGIVHVSDVIIRARGFGHAGDYSLPMMNAAAWEALSLSEEDLKRVLLEMEDALEDTESIFTEG
jgi:putative nucleotidyltransferase with HDIG domain